MHPTNFSTNLTLFSTAPVSMATQVPAATLKRDKNKGQIMDLIDLAPLRGADIKTNGGVKAQQQR